MICCVYPQSVEKNLIERVNVRSTRDSTLAPDIIAERLKVVAVGEESLAGVSEPGFVGRDESLDESLILQQTLVQIAQQPPGKTAAKTSK